MPFEAEHQRHIFAALETVPDASLDYLRDLAAAHLAALVEAFFVNGLVGRCRMSNAEDWAARM